MRRKAKSSLFLAVGMVAAMVWATGAVEAAHRGHVVWIIDQSDSAADGGGRLHIFQGRRSGRGPCRPRVS